MSKYLNPALLGNWENWVRVFLMVAIGFLIYHYAGQLIAVKKGDN